MSYTRLNPFIKVTNPSASNVTINHGSTYYANLGSKTDVPGYTAIGYEIKLTGMSEYSWLVPSALQATNDGILARIANFHPSVNSTGSWSARVFWAKTE